MFRDNIEGTTDFFANYIYPHPALQPEYKWLAANYSDIPIAAPDVQFIRDGRIYVRLDTDKTDESTLINQIAIYKLVDNEWNVSNVLPADGSVTNKNIGLELDGGSYVETFIDRFGREGLRHYFEVNTKN